MIKAKTSLLCMKTSLMKWTTHPRVWSAFLIMTIFVLYTFDGLPELAKAYHTKITVWVLPLMLSTPVMVAMHGGMTTLLFCNAPFIDNHTPFLVARAGRKSYIIGQFLYIGVMAFIFTAFMLAVSILSILPSGTFASEWGLLKGLANGSIRAIEHGIELSAAVHPGIANIFTPLEATAISFLFIWASTTFMGTIILCFNTMTGKPTGIIAAGTVTFIAYFSAYTGRLAFGNGIIFFSPFSWSNIYTLSFSMTEIGASPSATYALLCLAGLIIVLSIGSIIAFCKKDMNYPHWRD